VAGSGPAEGSSPIAASSTILVHPEVDEALRAEHAVVALETAVLTHGLPRTPLAETPPDLAPGWRDDGPVNLETTRACVRAVRAAGAVPAVVAVIDGALRIGLDDAATERLAADATAEKAAAPTLAGAMRRGASAGTTVSATLAACTRPAAGPIRVFATGGIGGVHPDRAARLDVSADLAALAATPVCVVCAGAKSILDLPATLEALETLGVPVVGHRTDHFPRFHAAGDADLPVEQRVETAAEAADLCRTAWDVLGGTAGVLLATPVPPRFAVERARLDEWIAAAEAAAAADGVAGAARTPYVLGDLARRSGGRTLLANVDLLVANATLAAEVAVALAGGIADDGGGSAIP
jgi:pseudouridine-5'-phosphate glycosidase